MPTPQPDQSGTVRALLITVALMFGIIVGLVAGILQRLDGGSIPATIEYGCGAFVAGVLFVFGIVSFWNGSQNRDS
jgi:hypothetical protein